MKPQWFRELFGFDEGPSFTENRDQFEMDGDVLVCKRNGARYHAGRFETPSLANLRLRALEAEALGQEHGALTFRQIFGDVTTITRDPANAGALFQAASQFNCLEMTGCVCAHTPRAHADLAAA